MKRTALTRSRPMPRRETPIKKGWIARGTKPIKKVNAERKAKRAKKFKAYLGSAAWKAKRQERFAKDGYRCTAIVSTISGARMPDGGIRFTNGTMRCEYRDETRTGQGLVCNHKTYARFGRENLSDLETLCRAHDREETVKHRANWMHR
jgi:hypothetical protein